MLSKKQEKLVRSLRSKKNRSLEKRFVVEGDKLFIEARSSGVPIETVFLSPTALERIQPDFDFIEISEREMAKISNLKSPPGLLAILPFLEPLSPASQSSDLILVLDDIQDPGNLGTIIRTAEGFGLKHIVCSENTVDAYNPKVVQASMGSIFRISLSYCKLSEYFDALPSTLVKYGASLKGENVYHSHLKQPALLLMGSESHGISDALAKQLDREIKIPQKGKVESMNVSIATAILLAEFTRQAGQ